MTAQQRRNVLLLLLAARARPACTDGTDEDFVSCQLRRWAADAQCGERAGAQAPLLWQWCHLRANACTCTPPLHAGRTRHPGWLATCVEWRAGGCSIESSALVRGRECSQLPARHIAPNTSRAYGFLFCIQYVIQCGHLVYMCIYRRLKKPSRSRERRSRESSASSLRASPRSARSPSALPWGGVPRHTKVWGPARDL